jgi:hypothetical protein
MNYKILITFVSLVLASGVSAQIFVRTEIPRNLNVRVHWDHVDYTVATGFMNERQCKNLEMSLRKWCRCPIRSVSRNGNLILNIEKNPDQGRCWVLVKGGPPHAVIDIDPNPPSGFQTVIDHEVHHMIQPFFHSETQWVPLTLLNMPALHPFRCKQNTNIKKGLRHEKSNLP